MKHYGPEQWADFVRQVAQPELRMAIQAHLQTGCRECRQTASLWEKVWTVAVKEHLYSPQEAAVRLAKAVYVPQRRNAPTLGERLAELIWDSMRQPQLAGVRSLTASPCQLIYRAGDYVIDLRVDSAPGSERFSLAGQILNSANPGKAVAQIPVTLEGPKPVTVTTNEFGEFHFDFDGGTAIRLNVNLTEGGTVIIPVGSFGPRKQ
jgi:hypothetical protein